MHDAVFNQMCARSLTDYSVRLLLCCRGGRKSPFPLPSPFPKGKGEARSTRAPRGDEGTEKAAFAV